MKINQQKITDQLKHINLANNSPLLDSGIIETIELNKSNITVKLNPQNIDQQELSELSKKIETELLKLTTITTVKVELTEDAQNQQKIQKPSSSLYFSNYDKIILIASGKGGVGKSTCSINIALALHQLGHKVAIFDADVYGPSMPLIFGLRGHKPQVKDNKIVPISKFGIDFLSIGNFIEEGNPVTWRGPLVHQALDQLMRDSNFPGGDYMIIDLPPGTGDVQLSLAQLTAAYGAIIVCTAQDIALIDARRAMAMFNKVNIPLLGMIENMSAFCCPHCNQPIDMFGSGKVQQESRNFKINYLGAIDLDPQLVTSTDRGRPILVDNKDSKASQQFIDIAKNIDKIKL